MNLVRNLIAFLCTLLILPTSSWNPYEILGVDQNADSSTIKKAYKQRAKEWLVDFQMVLAIILRFEVKWADYRLTYLT